jgi:phosphoglycolate phosphatase
MNTAPPKLVDVRVLIFDLDGTLIDSSQDLANAVNVARARLSLAPHPLERVMTYIGHGARELVRKSIADDIPTPTVEFLDEVVGYFRGYYAEHLLDHTVTYPGVRETLAQLKPDPGAADGYTLAVLTNKPFRFTKPILDGLNLTPYFRFIFGEESLETKKPDPAGVNLILRETGAGPREAVMVGDSDTDVLTARNAGCWSCGVTYGLSTATLAATPPDFYVDSLLELRALVESGRAG